ncbi:MAG: glycosyltransferase family 39 protein [Deltaproteobacteria bacterium]|nr:glycosyltransferase family 39 protein [Deltaproteobacteria bacterium]
MPVVKITLFITLTVLGISIRLIKITQPFVDQWSWRQSDVATIAENFYNHGFNVFYPQINWAGNAPGYVGTEFPLIPLIASLGYGLFGVHEWVGRLVSVGFFAASVPFFYLLAKKIYGERSAFFAVAVYNIVPLSVFAGRAFMPDMPALALSIIALYFFLQWLENERSAKLFTGAASATALAILMKLPAIILGLPYLYVLWQRYGAGWMQKLHVWGFAAASLALPALWYSHAFLISLNHFPFHFFGEAGLGILSLEQYWDLLRRIATSSLSPIVFAAMVIGIFLLPSRGELRYVFHLWLLANLLFIVFAGKGNRRHEWYQLPVAPIAAAFAGHVFEVGWLRLKRQRVTRLLRAFVIVVLFGALGYFSYRYLIPFYEPAFAALEIAGRELNATAPKNSLVAIADSGNPTGIYYGKRKGCHMYKPVDGPEAVNTLEELRKAGITFFVLPSYNFRWLSDYPEFREHLSLYQRVKETGEYIILDLTASKHEDRAPQARAETAQAPTLAKESLSAEICSCPTPEYRCRRG